MQSHFLLRNIFLRTIAKIVIDGNGPAEIGNVGSL
jgi:hypothetical protein